MKFAEVIGQDKIKEQLIRSVIEDRISHAQLFLGFEGSGNLALALAYAQYISCEDRQSDDSCGQCKSCHKYQKLIHPDLHFVYPVTTTKKITKEPVSDDFIEQWREALIDNPYIRLNQWYEKMGIENKQGLISKNESQEILKKLNLKSFESDYKIMIIWMPEKMNQVAANKLLKIIEEPPPETVFLLVANSTQEIIPTILSRTQIIRIPKLESSAIEQALQNKLGLSDDATKNIARVAGGNFSEAMEIAQNTEDAETNFNQFVNLMRCCYARKIPDVMSLTEELAGSIREHQKGFLSYSIRMLRENFLLNLKNQDIVFLTDKEMGFSAKFAPFINPRNIQKLVEEFDTAYYDVERNGNSKIIFLDLALKIMMLIRN